jgi:hypothetical protein
MTTATTATATTATATTAAATNPFTLKAINLDKPTTIQETLLFSLG